MLEVVLGGGDDGVARRAEALHDVAGVDGAVGVRERVEHVGDGAGRDAGAGGVGAGVGRGEAEDQRDELD